MTSVYYKAIIATNQYKTVFMIGDLTDYTVPATIKTHNRNFDEVMADLMAKSDVKGPPCDFMEAYNPGDHGGLLEFDKIDLDKLKPCKVYECELVIVYTSSTTPDGTEYDSDLRINSLIEINLGPGRNDFRAY